MRRSLRWPLLLTLVCALAPGSGAFAQPRTDDVPTASQLATHSRLVSGFDRKPDSERELWSMRIAGLDGTLETVRRGQDLATVTTLGPFRTARGVARGERWHQNENGQTILERPDPSQTERELAQSVARQRQPLDAWVVTTTYVGGHVARIFYDARTGYVVRMERMAAGRETHTVFEDFRTDARGRTRPWHYYGGDDRPENDYDYRLQRDDDRADVSEAAVALPHDRRALVDFPAGIDTVRLPARIENGRIYVRLSIAGRGLDFLLDTGAAALTIDGSVARTLGLAVYGRTAQTVAGTFETGRVIVPQITLGQLTMRDVVLRTVPFSSHETHGTRVVGLLGFDFLDALSLKIDYPSGTVDAMRPGALPLPADAQLLSVRLNSGAPVTRAIIGDAAGDDFIIDTGAAFNYVVFQRFARTHPDAFAPTGTGGTLYGSGVGGAMSYRNVTAKRLDVAGTSFEDLTGAEALSPSALGFDDEDGLIGSGVLKNFTMYLDYAANRLYLLSHRQPRKR